MAVNKKNIMTRYFFVILLMGLIGVAIVVKAGITMFAERQYWQDVADRFVKENVTVNGQFAAGISHLYGFQSRWSKEGHHADESSGRNMCRTP